MNTNTKTRSDRIKVVITLIAVIAIPLLYSFFYLSAFWNPYARLDQLPVAVVNSDTGAVIGGRPQNFGDMIAAQMQSSGTFQYTVTDAASAASGLDGNKYYAVITIPADFSSDIASAFTADKTPATITFTPNEGRNYLASQIMSSAASRLEESIRGEINGLITTQLTSALSGMASQPTQAAALASGVVDGGPGHQPTASGTVTR